MRNSWKKRLTDLIALLLGLMVIFPVVYGFCGAFKSPAEFAAQPPTMLPASFLHLDNFRQVLTGVPMGRYFLNSLAVAVLVSVVRLVCAALAAYAFACYTFRGRGVLFMIVLATMMLPPDTLMVTNYQTVTRMGLLNTWLGMSIVSFVGASQMFMLRQAFRSTPREFRQAAAMDGCGDLRYLWQILLPINRPVVVTLLAQSFTAAWNAYLWPLMATTRNEMRTVQVGIGMLTSIEATNYETVLAGVTLSLIPALLAFLLLRRGITQAMTGGSLVG